MKTNCLRWVCLLFSGFFISTLAASGQENNDEPVGVSLDEVRVLIIPAGVVGLGLPSGKILVVTPEGVEVRDAADPGVDEVSKIYDLRTREQIPEGDLQRLQDELKPAVMALIEALEDNQEGVEEEDVSLIVQLAILLGIRLSDEEEIRIAGALKVDSPVLIPGIREELLAEVNRILLSGQELGDAIGIADPLEREEDDPPPPPPPPPGPPPIEPQPYAAPGF